MLKKVVYTVITSTKYALSPIQKRTPGWDYVCFTNQKLRSKEWNLVRFSGNLDAKRLSREPKILYHKYVNDYDMSIYLDSKFTIRIDLDGFVQKRLGEADMAVMSHNKRICVYQEAIKVQKLKLDSKKVISKQVNKYRAEGFAPLSGLYAPGITIRRHGSEDVERCMELWFEELVQHSHRDILSLPYSLWKVPVKLKVMPWHEVYRLFRHKSKGVKENEA